MITKVNVVRYGLKLIKLPQSRYCRQAYDMLLKLNENGCSNWVTEVKNILCANGFGIVWIMQSVGCEKIFLSEFKERLKNCYVQEWRASLRDNENYSLYNSFKLIFEPEKYLSNGMYKPYKDALVKFRLRVSPILCHRNNFMPLQDNTCPICKQSNETEKHFILICDRLEQIRKSFLPIRVLEERSTGAMTMLFGNDDFSFVTGKYIFLALKYRMILIENAGV